MPETILIQPNRPLLVRLTNPQDSANYDFDARQGSYQTTTGQTLVLPRPAVLQLNELEAQPGEELEILKSWSGRRGEPTKWIVRRYEPLQAIGEPPATDGPPELTGEPQEAPQPIRGPSRRPAAREHQSNLFDARGTAAPRSTREIIPWNVAFREVSRFVAEELQGNRLQWSDTAQKNAVCTVLIAEAKKGRIGPWER